jgi:hypothetical protein
MSQYVSKTAEEFAMFLSDIKNNKHDLCLINDFQPVGIIEEIVFFPELSCKIEIVLVNQTMLLIKAYSFHENNKIQSWCIFSQTPYELAIYIENNFEVIKAQSFNL